MSAVTNTKLLTAGTGIGYTRRHDLLGMLFRLERARIAFKKDCQRISYHRVMRNMFSAAHNGWTKKQKAYYNHYNLHPSAAAAALSVPGGTQCVQAAVQAPRRLQLKEGKTRGGL